MKLISCYIEKFGGLSGYALDFEQGVTVIHAPNGFGKTTLAEFLRAMFYGFPRKAKTLDKSRRQKYTPWSGGKFGGNLVFEHEGRRYRLERSFGATPRSDSFALIDLETGTKSDRFSEEIGLELFKLDADSFERSTYMPQLHDISSLTTTGIQAKLGDLVEDTGDINNFDKAVTALKTKRSGYIPYRGSGGTVAEATSQISRIQQELDRIRLQKEQLTQCVRTIAETEAGIESRNAEIAENRKQWELASEAAASRRQCEDLRSRYNAAAVQLNVLQERYPCGIPEESELEAARAIADEIAALENSGLSDRERAQYEKLRPAFNAGALEEARLDDLAEQNRQLLRQRAALESLTVSDADRQQMNRLKALFPRGVPDQEEIHEYRQTLTRIDDLRREKEQLKARAAEPSAKQNPLLLIPGAVGILIGAVLLVLQHLIPGGVVLAVGIALLAAGVLVNTRKRRTAEAFLSNLHYQVESIERQITDAENRAREFALGYGLEGDASAALDEIQRRQEEAENLREKLRVLKEKRAVQEEQIRRMEDALRSQLGSDDFDRAISNLRLAREKVLQWMEQEKQRNEKRAACEEKLNAILAPYGLGRSGDLRRQLQQLHDDRRIREQADTLAKQLEVQLLQFPEIPAEAAEPAVLQQTGRRLSGELTALTEQLLRQRQLCAELQNRVDQIPELSDELERWQERKIQHQKNAAILDDTMDFLTKARESLTTSYLGPIRESFDRYMTRLTAGQRETVFISPDLQVQLERQGQARELAYFSAGQTDLVMLCMRLALVDALFADAKPFVILDDPFVNLDDERTAEALRLLETLGEDRQIIYLTCSASRKL